MFMIRGRVLLYVCFDRGIKDADVDDMLFLMFGVNVVLLFMTWIKYKI